MAHALTKLQQAFIDAYLVEPNAGKAYLTAGYKANTANIAAVAGHKLLKHPKVAAALTAAQGARAKQAGINTAYVLERLQAVAEKAEGLRPVKRSVRSKDEKTGKVAYVEIEITVFEPAAANAAYGLIGKHLGMFTEKVEHTGKDGKPIETINRYETMDPAELRARIDRELERRAAAERYRLGEAAEGADQSNRVH